MNIQMIFLDTITFHNVEHRISSEMDFPEMYLIYRPDIAIRLYLIMNFG